MRVIDKKTDGETLAVTLLIEPEEFAEALREAYLDDSERYVVPGYAPGLAPRAAIEAVYGPEALFDEAIAAALPAAYGKFLAEEKPRTVGKPEASDITLLAGGGLRFRVRADLCPRVRLGAYKGLRITLPEGADEENFRMAALRAACKEMEGRPSEAMVRRDSTRRRRGNSSTSPVTPSITCLPILPGSCARHTSRRGFRALRRRCAPRRLT